MEVKIVKVSDFANGLILHNFLQEEKKRKKKILKKLKDKK